MLRHPGHRRTFRHNIRLAALLCITAGFVNVAGFRAFMVLTTNVTGHVALFAEELAEGNFSAARTVGLWMLLFFLGAFLCSLWIHRTGRWRRFSYSLPILVEVVVLVAVGVIGSRVARKQINIDLMAGSLLFIMGVQNAMVSVISGAVVRTTHLTGMFTDLGIDLSAITSATREAKPLLRQKIVLRVVIIFFFFLGGIAGGYLFTPIGYSTFYIPAGILVLALIYDVFRVRLLRGIRKFKSGNSEALKPAP
ncbi:MAG TPA: YoaK family protein [Bacteroidia bacterium]|nr:YoaK family protein [Bacteroidia bacterium]